MVEVLVEVFEFLFVDDKLFLGEEEGIDGGVEPLFEEVKRREGIFAVDVVFLFIEFSENFFDLGFRQMIDNVFNAIDKDGVFGSFVLVFGDGPDVAFVIANVDGNILPEFWSGDRLVASDEIASEAVDEKFVCGAIEQVVE